jgi:hypothetical protein
VTGGGPLSPRERLLGTWDLVSFVRLVDGDPVDDVLGPDPVGRLTYQPDGRVTALLARRDRPWRSGETFLSAGDEARGAAAREFVAYSGRFEVVDDRVVHHVDISLYPEHPGTDLVRTVSWRDGLLELRTPSRDTRSGRSMCDRLTWRPESGACRPPSVTSATATRGPEGW